MPTTLTPEIKQDLEKIANTLRGLSIDGVQKANSGHPGLPLGCADLAAYLWGYAMRYNPKDPKWVGRDRFVLSAGHGCMLQYSALHVAGYDLSIDDLKSFRQLHSKTPGHPEYGHTAGIDVTTGPLGQGIGFGIGMGLGEKILGTKFNTETHHLFDNKIFILAGDGCFMEGVSSEVSSLAGHLHINNVILFYDFNQICLDGPISETLSEDTKARYKAYGWDVFEIDGANFDEMDNVVSALREKQDRPALVITKTIIGKGSPNKAGTHKVHGSPLGAEEVFLTKKALGLPEEDFFVPQAVRKYFEAHGAKCQAAQAKWESDFQAWSQENPDLLKVWKGMQNRPLPQNLESEVANIEMASPIAGRAASNQVINRLGELLDHLYGGSADLSCSDLTMMKSLPVLSRDNFSGRNIKYGVREFGMATIAVGLSLTDFITPFIGTFLTFSDYMRNSIRLASLMKIKVIYQFTHDSIFLGEDGPTHQPVEHYMTLRAIPNLQLIRPGDANEVKMGWVAALKYEGPTAIILTRQGLPELEGTKKSYADGVGRGAYIAKACTGKPNYTLFATGSELSLAHDVATELTKRDKQVRIVSMPCWELFEKQPRDYKESVVGGDLGHRVSLESGIDLGWYKWIGREGTAISVDKFGASAPASALAKEYGFTVEDILARIL